MSEKDITIKKIKHTRMLRSLHQKGEQLNPGKNKYERTLLLENRQSPQNFQDSKSKPVSRRELSKI
jgi:hypothetical protein